MPDPRFFKRLGPFRVSDVAARCGAVVREGDPAQEVKGLAELASAEKDDLCFLSGAKYAAQAKESAAGFCLTTESLTESAPPGATVLTVEDPQTAFSIIADAFYQGLQDPICGVEPNADGALIHPEATLSHGVKVGAGSVIGPGVEIGAGSQIGSMTTIGTGVSIGASCDISSNVSLGYCVVGSAVIIHPGVRIGQDGFGFVFDSVAGRHRKVPQLGRVVICDDVEIGANTTIDRGTLADTVIAEGCRIDNQVQIGHNVVLGKRCIIVSQVGISGSCTIGDDVVIAGQVGMADHVTVGPKAQIAAKSGVMRDIPPGEAVMGYPAKPIRTFWRETAALGRLTSKGKSS